MNLSDHMRASINACLEHLKQSDEEIRFLLQEGRGLMFPLADTKAAAALKEILEQQVGPSWNLQEAVLRSAFVDAKHKLTGTVAFFDRHGNKVPVDLRQQTLPRRARYASYMPPSAAQSKLG